MRTAIFIAVLLLPFGNALGDDVPVLKGDRAALSYSVGYQVGSDFIRQGKDIDPEVLLRGVEDALSKRTPRLSRREMQATLAALQRTLSEARQRKMMQQAEKRLADVSVFLDENKKKKDVVTLPTGLQYQILVEGTGPRPTASGRVTVHYTGTLLDGTVFDSSYRRKEPSVFNVSTVIKGWQEALPMMKEGSTWRLFVPPDLAYGDKRTGLIPPNSALIFDVELLKVEKGG